MVRVLIYVVSFMLLFSSSYAAERSCHSMGHVDSSTSLNQNTEIVNVSSAVQNSDGDDLGSMPCHQSEGEDIATQSNLGSKCDCATSCFCTVMVSFSADHHHRRIALHEDQTSNHYSGLANSLLASFDGTPAEHPPKKHL